MAVLALGFVGQALGGYIGGSFLGIAATTIGGFIGSSIGTMVDNLLFPKKQEGPRLEDLTVQASTYGKVISLPFGPENRMAGNVIWSTGLIETKKKTKQGGKGGPTVNVTEYSYRVSMAVGLAEGPITAVRKVWANAKLIWEDGLFTGVPEGETAPLFATMQVYPGDFIQDPDPTIESYLGAGLVPAYRGTAYVVIADFQLADFGNRIPNLEFLVEQAPASTVDVAVLEICQRCGIDANLVGSSSLGFPELRGYVIGNSSSGVGALQPLALVYDFDVAEVAGGLRIVPKTSAYRSIIPHDALAGHQGGEDRPEAIRWARAQETQLPRESTITYPDPDRDYQPSSQAERRSQGSADSNLASQVSVVIDATTARKLAARTLWEAWTARESATTATDDRWLMIEPGLSYLFPTPAGLEALRVVTRSRGANGVLELTLRRDRTEVYSNPKAGAPAAVPVQTVDDPGEAVPFMLDIPLLIDADDNPGFYWVINSAGSGFRGADFQRSVNAGVSWDEVAAQGFEATVGDIDGILDAGDDPLEPSSSEFDDVTVLTVTLRADDMALFSVDDDELFAGANACFVGDPDDSPSGEIIQFGVATLTAGTTYELTHLLRGRRGTEFARELHVADEVFIFLEPGPVRRANFGAGDLGQARDYRAVPLLADQDEALVVGFTNTGVGLRPYSPTHLVVTGDTGDDLELAWIRRSRIGGDIDPPPLGEDSELYRVRIMNALGTVVMREVDVTTPEFLYTAAMQTADFGGVVSDLRWRVAQVSAIFGAGIYSEDSGPV